MDDQRSNDTGFDPATSGADGQPAGSSWRDRVPAVGVTPTPAEEAGPSLADLVKPVTFDDPVVGPIAGEPAATGADTASEQETAPASKAKKSFWPWARKEPVSGNGHGAAQTVGSGSAEPATGGKPSDFGVPAREGISTDAPDAPVEVAASGLAVDSDKPSFDANPLRARLLTGETPELPHVVTPEPDEAGDQLVDGWSDPAEAEATGMASGAVAVTAAAKPEKKSFWPWGRKAKDEPAAEDSSGTAADTAPVDTPQAVAGAPIFGSELPDDGEWPSLPTDDSFDEVAHAYAAGEAAPASSDFEMPDWAAGMDDREPAWVDESSLTVPMEPIRTEAPGEPVPAAAATGVTDTAEPAERLEGGGSLMADTEPPEPAPGAPEAMPEQQGVPEIAGFIHPELHPDLARPEPIDLPAQVAGRPGPMLYSYSEVVDTLEEQTAAARVADRPEGSGAAIAGAAVAGAAAAAVAGAAASHDAPEAPAAFTDDASALTQVLDMPSPGAAPAGLTYAAEPGPVIGAPPSTAAGPAGTQFMSAGAGEPPAPTAGAEPVPAAEPVSEFGDNPLRERLETGRPVEVLAAPATPTAVAPVTHEVAPMAHDLEGAGARLIGGRFRAIERLDRGGTAETYKVIDEQGSMYAVDLLHPNGEREIQHLRDSMLAVAALQTANIARVYEWGTDESGFYVVREFVEGWDLETLLTRGPLDPLRVSRYGAEAALGMAAAHAAGIVHGSLRTSDVIITPEGAVKVIGLGQTLPRTLTPQSPPAAAYFLSPEQVRGEAPTDSSDIYALGIILYESGTGVVPFEGSDAGVVAEEQLNSQPEALRRVNPIIPASVEVVVSHALRKMPKDRYRTMDEFRQDLDRVGDQIQSGAVSEIETAPTLKKSRRWVWITALAVLGVLLLAGGAGGFVWWRNSMAQVPNLIGVSPEAAKTKLAQAGLSLGDVTYTQQIATSVREGDVLSQDPKASDWLRRGAKVNLTINGPQKVIVPNVVGKPQAEALSAVQTAGLIIGTITQTFDATVAAGTVISQTATAGVEVAKGTAVGFEVSKGPQSVAVPSVVGQAESAAVSALTKAGFKSNSIKAASDTIASGMVISQTPSAGTAAKVGDTITIQVSTGAQTIQAPNVVGKTMTEAAAIIQAQKLIVKIIERTTTASADIGKVLDQSPSSGTSVKAGDTITITVGKS